MSSLYNQLSEVYEAMYQSFINYEEEYNFYSRILSQYQCTGVLEIGCGTGHLAERFAKNNFEYTGIDLSEDMLTIARANNPRAAFYKMDMRDFSLPKQSASAIITGRTISYLITNDDVYNALNSINKNLSAAGVICFDCIDASAFIPSISKDKKIIHKAGWGNKKFSRESYWSVNLQQSWTFDWHSIYYEEKANGELIKIGEDKSTIRSFTKDEMVLFLRLTGFELKEIIDRPSYAFDTFVVVAKKVNS
jgi:SAM-dependent methyltransferase